MAATTMLQIVQEFCKRRGMPIPSTVVSAQDDTVQQMWGLLNEGVDYITNRVEWQGVIQRYGPFFHGNLGAYAALDLSENGPIPDYGGFINRSLWDNNSRREVNGPLTPKEWELLLNLNISQAVYNFTVSGNFLRIYPVPSNPLQTFSFQYLSKCGCISAATDTPALTPTQLFFSDASTSRIPTSILLAELRWRWNAERGLPYAELQKLSDDFINNWLNREPQPDISMDNDHNFNQVAAPGLLVAAGSWNLP
jgi:hypothetical protein